MRDAFVLGLDFGTDSCRALVVEASSGRTAGEGRAAYPRWRDGLYCRPDEDVYRQHPLDYLEALEAAAKAALACAGSGAASRVAGLCADATGSTPGPVDEAGRPLGLDSRWSENPAALFRLWKDHSAAAEAEEFNRAARAWDGPDYLRYQGLYSSEWYWAKVLRAVREEPLLRSAAWTWVEECEWIPNLLAGTASAAGFGRSACAAGHKLLWHSAFGGLPERAFLASLDPYLGLLRDRYLRSPQTPDRALGRLCPEWASRLGLSADCVVAGGLLDAHAGGVGAGVRPGTLVKVMGTSAVDLLVESPERLAGGDTKELFGMAENSILPGYVGIEAGQAAFGDLFAWFKDKVLLWPLRALGTPAEADALSARLLPALEARLLSEAPPRGVPVALDWLNGRRYPRSDDGARSAFSGIGLNHDAADLYRALVLGALFGAKRIAGGFTRAGVRVDAVAAAGGVARKSPYAMQALADVFGLDVSVSSADQACAKGAAMFAAAAAGLCPDLAEAQARFADPVERVHRPRPEYAAAYAGLYADYLDLAGREEQGRKSH